MDKKENMTAIDIYKQVLLEAFSQIRTTFELNRYKLLSESELPPIEKDTDDLCSRESTAEEFKEYESIEDTVKVVDFDDEGFMETEPTKKEIFKIRIALPRAVYYTYFKDKTSMVFTSQITSKPVGLYMRINRNATSAWNINAMSFSSFDLLI